MKIGLLGGSFDPIHNAHVQMAKYARQQLGLDEVWFVVAKDTPLKERKLAPFMDRCRMVEIAIAAYRHFRICDIEAEIEGKSYTINTVLLLKEKYPDAQFYFIVGQDQVAQLNQWRDIDQLMQMIPFCAFARNNREIDDNRILALQMPAYEISSTDVRNGNFTAIHKCVANYAMKHMLYMDFVKKAMSDYRYQHSISVANLCVEIAKANHLDIHKAYLCGLLHDINKEFKMIDQTSSEQVIRHMRPHLLSYNKSIWHGYLGSFICAHKLLIKDNDILTAIENHVLGDSSNRYAMLMYVSDKLDPLRDYDTTQQRELCMHNLIEGYKEVKKQQKKFYGENYVSGK